jgi:hypothetical protein
MTIIQVAQKNASQDGRVGDIGVEEQMVGN